MQFAIPPHRRNVQTTLAISSYALVAKINISGLDETTSGGQWVHRRGTAA